MLSQASDQLRLGFEADGDGFHAGASTHDATVSGGELVMVPHDLGGEVDGAPVRFATSAIERGDFSLAAGDVSPFLRGDGTLAIARGPVTEIVENRDDGVEQSWQLAAAPEGEGELLVAVAVNGHQEVRSSQRGLHFLSGDGLGFSYSHAMWVDASQTSWDIPVSWDGSRIVMRVPASVIDRTSFPAVLDPVIGPERRVDAAVAGFTGGPAIAPAISRGANDTYLVVWTDNRNGTDRESEVWAARVASNGIPLERRGIAIGHTTVMEHEPAVTWTGTEWLVAWTREDATNAGIAAATVSLDGVVTDLGVVANTFAFESEPALASGGDGNALLVYTWNLQIRGARFAAGAFSDDFNVSNAEANDGLATVAASGSNYLVAWQLGSAPGLDIYGRIINLEGGNPAPFVISDAPEALFLPAATFDGTNYVAAWRRTADIWGARITTDGAVLDSTDGVGGRPLVATPEGQTDPAISCGPIDCLLAWADRSDLSVPDVRAFDLHAQRLRPDLTTIGGPFTVSGFLRNQTDPTVATVGTSAHLVAWTDVRSGVAAIFATRITANGAVVNPDGVLVNRAVRNAQSRPAYAIGATTQLAAWSDSRSFGDDIFVRRFASDGTNLEPAGVALSSAEWDQTSPAVDFDGSQYVAAWRDTRNTTGDVYAARMAEDGTVLDPAGIPVTTAANGQNAPDVASGDGGTLIVWQDRRNLDNDYDIMAAVMAPDGSLAAADIPICQLAEEQSNPAVAWDPNSSLYVVVWTDHRAGVDGGADVYAARVEPDGTVLDPCGVPISQELTSWQQAPDIAVSGSQLLVVWEDYRNDFFGDVFGGRITVDAGGITRLDGDGAPIATGASWQTTPAVAGVGLGRWGIAWVDTINENTAGTDVLGNTMQSDGSLEPAYLISGGVYFEMGPVFQSGGGDSNVAYLVYEYDRPSTGRLRVLRRQLTY